MKPVDYLKAAGLGLAVLAANLALLVAIVFVWSQAFARGRPPEFYSQLAMDLGAWTGPAGGVGLMFLATFWLGRRRPQRNPVAFGAAAGAAYVVLDVALGIAAAPVSELVTARFLLTLTAVLAAGVAGGWLARRPVAAAA